MLFGLDQLGAAKYADVAVREHPQGWVFGVFTNTFGDAAPVVAAIAKGGRAAGIRLNLAWKDAHNFSRKDFDSIAKEAKRFAPLIKRFPNLTWYVSGATEHTLSGPDAYLLREKVLGQLPSSAIYVNNPWDGKGAFLEGAVNEVHGADAQVPNIGGRFGFSCDGSDCFDVDITKLKERFAGAEYFMFWCSQFNGRKNASDPTPRPQRKAWPGAQLIDATIYLHNDQGDVSLPKNYLIKPKADQHSVPPEPRALKPVVICPVKADRLELVASNGQVVAVSSASQPFADGRYRYYFDQYGYQISEKAKRIHGSPVVSMRVNRKIVGTCNLAFRQGGFR